MGLLLDAWRVVASDGTQKLTLVHVGGGIETVVSPMLPYAYMQGTVDETRAWIERAGVPDLVKLEEERCVALSNLEAGASTWTKATFRNVNAVSAINKALGGNEPPARSGMSVVWAENHLTFTERVGADMPEWYGAQTEKTATDLRMMWLDIEQFSKPSRFPDEDDPIISVAWEAQGPDLREDLREGILIIDDADLSDERQVPGVGLARSWDRRILKAFSQIFSQINPDVVVGYNLHDFDLPMLIARSRRVGIGAQWLCRKGSPRITDEKVGMWEKRRTQLGGRIVFDVFERVQIDQSLNGKVKDRSLKTVAAYRGLHIERIPAGKTFEEWKNNRPRLISYNKNDVTLARGLGDTYWQNVLAYAELTKAPLRFVVDGTANYFGTRFSAEDFRIRPAAWLNGARVLSDGTNYRRFQHLNGFKPEKAAMVTGAKVGIHKKGAFRKGIWKIDVGGLYPSIIETLGLSPDNVVHVGFEQPEDWPIFFARLVPGSPVSSAVNSWREYHIPDEEWKGRHIIRVYGRGSLSVRIKKNKEIRAAVKRSMKVIEKRLGKDAAQSDPEWLALDGQQQMLKQANNSVYGNNSNDFSRYGSFAVGMTITGIGRVILSTLEGTLDDNKVESDTDGIYCDSPIDVDATNKLISSFVKERCLVDENTIQVELEDYAQGFFHSMKNYALLGKDGKVVRHGSAIVGAKHAALWDDAVEKAVAEVFGLAPVGSYVEWRAVTESMLKTGRIGLDRLVQRQAVKPTSEYATNAQGRQIAASHVQVFGREPHPDSKVEFVQTRTGVEVAAAPGIEKRIDVKHYVDLLKDVEKLFLLGKQYKTPKLSSFLTTE